MDKLLLTRTIKTALAAFFSIIIAQTLGLEYGSAAGIIAILNIFETRKSTIEGGLKRALSAIIALLIGGFLFELIGYENWVFALYLLVFVPLSFLLKIELGLGPSSVLVTHLLAFGQINLSIIFNEIGLVFIGTSLAMVTNIYAPKSQDDLLILIKSIDEDMKYILNLFGKSLVEILDVKFYEDRILNLENKIKKAKDLASIEAENMIEYSSIILYGIHLRESELELLESMYEDLKSIPAEYDDGTYVSDILIQCSENLTEDGDIRKVKDNIEDLKSKFHLMDLPKNHEEFAIRSAVFQVFRSLEEFINISTYINETTIV